MYLGLHATEDNGWDVVRAYLALEGERAHSPDIFRAFAVDWFKQRELDGRVRGVDDERSVWRTRVECADFIDWPMRRIKPRHIQAHVRKLLRQTARYTLQKKGGSERHDTKRRLSRQSVVHALRLIKAVLHDARIAGKIQSNPAHEVKLPKREDDAADRDPIVYATAAELRRLFALELPDFERTAFTVAVYTGLRMGEIWGLRWEDVTLAGPDPVLRVRKSYDGPPKTKAAIRDVPALAPVVAALSAWKRRSGVQRIGGLVFPAKTGGHHSDGYDAGWADKRYRQGGELKSRSGWRSKAKIRDAVTFHCLRHTTACHLLQGTWVPAVHPRALSLLELRDWLGHSSIGVTEQRYARLAPGNLLDAVRADRPKVDRKPKTALSSEGGENAE